MKQYIIFFVILTLFSCSQTTKRPAIVPQITIDIDKAVPLVLSDFFDDVSYVALSDSFLIGDIERAKVYDDRLLVLTNKSILMYDINTGKVMLRIRKFGKGPGEYVSLYDMLIDKTSNTIELLDMNGQKILKYDIKGNFTDEFKTSFFSFSFYKRNNTDYWFYNNNMMSDITDHRLIRYNPEKKMITAQYFIIDKHLAEYFYVIDANNFNFNPLSFYFCPSDTIYEFSDSDVPYPRYTINFASHHTPAGFYKAQYSDIADFDTKASRNSYIYFVTNFVENDKLAFFSFSKDRDRYWALYSKKHQIARQGNAWIDDFHFTEKMVIDYENEPVALDNGKMYFFVQPAQLMALMKNYKFQKASPKTDKLLEILHSANFSEQSNPILVICKLKKSE